MKPSAMRAPATRRRAAARRARAGAQVSRRRHQPRRPDARDVERPDALVDVTGLSRRDRGDATTAACGSAPRVKNTALAEHRAVRDRYPLLAHAILAGASRADPQHGDGRRQPPAAHALRLLL